MSEKKPAPEKVLRMATGYWASAILTAAEAHGIFTILEGGPKTPEEVAEAAKISLRGSRALLDGLVGAGLVELAGGRYENGPEASAFLVHGREPYLGDYVRVQGAVMGQWTDLTAVVRAGLSPHTVTDAVQNSFWEELAPAIAANVRPAAEQAVGLLGIPELAAPRFLDVGGGSGIYAVVWLHAHPQATLTQIDWPNVNRLAREFAARQGVGERFETVDGNFHDVDFGTGLYDAVVLSNIAHQESPESNLELLRRVRRALKEGGALLMNEVVTADDMSAHPFAYLFHVNMLLHTHGGAAWRRHDYEAWLREAGFSDLRFEPTATTTTLIVAR